MRYDLRFKTALSHPVGYVLLWIVAFGLVALIGRFTAQSISSIKNELHYDIVQNVASILTVGIALVIITAGFGRSHLARFDKNSLVIFFFIFLIIWLLSALAVRAYPSNAFLIMSNGLFLVLLSFCAGELLSREVLHAGHLIPVTLVLALIDIWSVSKGPSSKVATEITEFAGKGGFEGQVAPPWTSFLLLRFPHFAAKEIYSFLGVGDLVIIAFLIGCIYRFNLPRMTSYSALVVGTMLAVLVANLLSKPIPALPIIAILFMLVNLKSLSMKRNDMIMSVLVILIIIAVITILSIFR